MRASGPTARPAHPFAHFVQAHRNPPLSRFFLLGRGHPANPLIARQRRYFLPQGESSNISRERLLKITRNGMG